MAFNLIFSQGRIGDKTEQTIKGAELTAKALEQHYGVKAISVGKTAPPADDDWRISLPQAKKTLTEIRDAIIESSKDNKLTVLASNTCSASLASLPVVAQYHPDAIVLWFDGHGDFNTPETTSSGYLGGMVLSAVCGLWDSGHGAGLRPEQTVVVGAHDIDQAERELLQKAGVRIIPPQDVKPETILKIIGESKVWIHVDWDVLEPGFIPADYKVSGGLLLTQLQEVFKALPVDQVLGIELAEFEVSSNEKITKRALLNILDTVKPLLG